MAVTILDLDDWFSFEFDPFPFYEVPIPFVRGDYVSPCFGVGSYGSPDTEDNHIDSHSESEPPSKRQKRGESSSENQDRLHNGQSNDLLPGGGVGGRSIGNLPSSSKEIGEGSNGTKGRLGVHRVESNRDPVRLDRDRERRSYRLDDLIQAHRAFSNNSVFRGFRLWTKDGYLLPSLKKKVMSNIILELQDQHGLRRIHGNLKPQTVFITVDQSLCAKLSNRSKRPPGETSFLASVATGWQAHEQLCGGSQSYPADVFNLGLVLFFIISGGKHPFGDPHERDDNILNDKMDLSSVELTPEAKYLFSRLLNRKPEVRPAAWEVLPCFWNPQKKLYFYFRFSQILHSKNRAPHPDLLKELDSKDAPVFGGEWIKRIDPQFKAEIKKRNDTYDYRSVKDLLRFVRNKWAHINEQKILGQDNEAFYSYFAARFPSLWMKSYRAAYRYYRRKDWFRELLSERDFFSGVLSK